MRSFAIWFPVHVDCPDHPKTVRFARLLKLKIPHALGHLVMFWRWAIQYSDRGSLEGYSNEDISTAAGYAGDPEKFVEALLSCGVRGPGYLERNPSGTLDVHDYASYLGVLADKRRKGAETKAEFRKRKAAEKAASEEPVRETSSGHPSDVQGMSDLEERRGEESRSSASKKRPGSLEEVHELWAEKNLRGGPENAELFWLHYETNGWRTTAGPVKNWHTCAQKWSRNEFGAGGNLRKLAPPPPQRDPSENARRLAEARAMGERKA